MPASGCPSLQWGRRPTSTATADKGDRVPIPFTGASMGPSTNIDGDRVRTTRWTAWSSGASMGPSTNIDGDAAHRQTARRGDQASMGPSTNIDGDVDPGQRERGVLVASMGPSTNIDGDVTK